MSFLLLSLSALSLSVVFYLNSDTNWVFGNQFTSLIAQAMLYYLFFILVRTSCLLALSFFELLSKKRMPPVKNYPLVTILIPCYNEEKVLQEAIHSVGRIEYPNIEVIIIDDGSSDDTFLIAKQNEKDSSNIRVVLQRNQGKASALNNGISMANGDYYICMDADSSLSSNVLLNSIPYFEEDPHLAAVAGSVQIGNGNSLFLLFQKLEYIVGLSFHKSAQSFLNMVTIVPGPIGVFRKSFAIEVGLYKTDTYAEDCDISMRLLMAGYNIKYNSSITAITEGPETLQGLITQRYRWSRGMIQSISKALKESSRDYNFRKLSILTYMFLETVLIPIVNFTFVMISLEFALIYDTVNLLGPFFIGLTVLDLSICLYSIIMEKSIGVLFILGIFNRVTYGLCLEVIRFLSIIDEVFKLPMKWGTIKREGLKK